MIKVVIFDYGGVIKDGHNLKEDIPIIYDISKEEIKKAENKTEPIFTEFEKGALDERKFWQKLSNALGKSVPNNCIELSRKIYDETFVFFPEMIDLIKELRMKGIMTVVLSNILNFQAEIIREKGGYENFDMTILSYEEKLNKPELDFYVLAVKRLKIKPEECIFIDDKEKNLPPAKNIGMKTILFENPKQAIEEIFLIINSEK